MNTVPLDPQRLDADDQMSAKTKNMFGKAQFDAMKDGSVLVNTAR